MLDIKFIKENPNKVKQGCKKKQVDIDIDLLLKIDKERIKILKEVEEIRTEKNKSSKIIPKTKDKKEKEKIITEMRKIDKIGDKLEKKLSELEEKIEKLAYQIPNMPLDNVPEGKDETGNLVLRKEGKMPQFDFEPKDYLEISKKFDLIDIERASKIAGSRFGFLKNEVVLLEFALVNFVLENLGKEGFIPVIPPVMMKSEKMRGMGYLEQTDRDEAYYLPKDDLFLAGTSEQPLGAMHSDEVFDYKELPRRYVGFSSCFRREAGSYGKDTKGILRVHQFDKLEMFSFSKPEESEKEHQFLLKMEENLMQQLRLHYQVLHICSGDLGLPAATKYDIETWIPSQKVYRETHSVSNCTDFQSKRLNIKYRDKNNELKFVHTLNGTAFAIGRILIAIIENYQQKDGTIKIPEAL
ncbi:MAG: serine--tRNA ligase, partial [Patescibacteria group bacterium]|nr:serine--tRNA ligase [Patescibacteria group bacterium]